MLGSNSSQGSEWAALAMKAAIKRLPTIPAWMWDIFRAEQLTPPFYRPGLGYVEWDNRRRPVTDRGTEFVEAVPWMKPGRNNLMK